MHNEDQPEHSQNRTARAVPLAEMAAIAAGLNADEARSRIDWSRHITLLLLALSLLVAIQAQTRTSSRRKHTARTCSP